MSFSSSTVATDPTTNSPALINRSLDFWLLGGFSLVVWFVLLIFQNFKALTFVQAHFNNIPYAMATLSLVCNYPHFLASYKIAYSRGSGFVRQNWFQLLVAPSILLGILSGAYFLTGQPQQLVLGYMVNLMFFSVGWHYTKQSFGCVMVYSRYDNYQLTRFQKELLRFSLLGIWWVTLAQSNLYGGISNFYGLNFKLLDFPDWVYPAAYTAVGILFMAVCLFVFFYNWRATRTWPSMNMLIPFIAIYVWWLPIARQNDFYIYLTPFFHSLQYLAFVYKFEKSKAAAKTKSESYWVWVVLGLIVSGWMFFEIIPHTLDQQLGTKAALSVPFFIIAFNLFINIHHYFIDNAIWRLKDPEVRRSILSH